MSARKKGPFCCKRWVCKSNIYRGRTSPGVTRTGQGVTWARQQRRGHAHGCPNEKYHSSPQNQIKSRNFSSTNRSFLIKIQDLVGFCCGTVLATREGQGHAADGAVDGLEFVGQFSRITPWNFGIPPWHRSSHTGRSGACRRRIVLVTREGLRRRGRSRRRNGVLWEVFPHNRLDEDEDARVGLWARWFFMPSAAEPAPLDAAICPHALALRGVVRSAGLDLAEAGACEWYRGCLCLLAPCLGPER